MVKDIVDTLRANEDECVGMAANMIGVKNFNFAAADNVYVSTDKAGTTSGILNINGKQSGETLSTINLNTKDGFVLTEDNTLNFSNTKLTGSEIVITNNGGTS